MRRDALAREKEGKLYKCEMCLNAHPKEEVKVDHRSPVVDPEVGFVDWNTYISRMFCHSDYLAIVCRKCHSDKTRKENLLRAFRKKTSKNVIPKKARVRKRSTN